MKDKQNNYKDEKDDNVTFSLCPYALAFEDAKDKNFSMTGAKLMDEGVNVPMGTNASEIIWINCEEGK
ncbi:MAG: hypothetical protein WCS31_15060 [Verrucomicrobiae bacterium]